MSLPFSVEAKDFPEFLLLGTSSISNYDHYEGTTFGYMDNLRIWDRALTREDVQLDMFLPTQNAIPNGLVGNYDASGPIYTFGDEYAGVASVSNWFVVEGPWGGWIAECPSTAWWSNKNYYHRNP